MNYTVACLNYTLQTMMLADQLWLLMHTTTTTTSVYDEERCESVKLPSHLSFFICSMLA